jgi:hypothetical protein
MVNYLERGAVKQNVVKLNAWVLLGHGAANVQEQTIRFPPTPAVAFRHGQAERQIEIVQQRESGNVSFTRMLKINLPKSKRASQTRRFNTYMMFALWTARTFGRPMSVAYWNA